MKPIFSVLLVAILLVSVVQANNYNEAESLTIESTVTIPVSVVRTTGSFSFDYITVNYSWLPVDDYRQQILAVTSTPKSQNLGNSLFFEIGSASDFELKVNFQTVTSSNPVKVRTKVDFPIRRLDSELLEFTKPSKLVDINEDIRAVASSLARGEDDLYVVVFKIGDWINTNIEYNLSTLTAEASLPSSWVLRERQGVCDELSNLFVSMLRSLGIPARTVTGISYTDSELFDYNWGAHGWTEVYFPGYGWVPFDPTYNQLGYVDATHIKLGDKKGDERFNTEFEWKGKGFTVEPLGQNVDSKVIDMIPKITNEVDMKLYFMRDTVGFGSYNVVVAEVENKEKFYITRVLDISRVQGIQVLDEARRDILLKPKEKKRVYWIVKINENLNPRYVYTFPFTAYSSFEEFESEGFKATKTAEQITLKAAQAFSENEDDPVRISQMHCYPVEESIYMKQQAEIKCLFSNEAIEQVKLCVNEKCETRNIIDGEASVKLILSEPGIRTFLVEAEAPGYNDESFVTIEVIDAASILIRNLDFTEKIKYDETASLEFLAMRDSSSVPKNVSIKIIHDLFEKEWVINSLEQTQGYKFFIKGKDLKNKDNIIKIEITYYDNKGRRYLTETSIEIEFVDLTLFQRIALWLNNLGAWFN